MLRPSNYKSQLTKIVIYSQDTQNMKNKQQMITNFTNYYQSNIYPFFYLNKEYYGNFVCDKPKVSSIMCFIFCSNTD